VAAVPSEPNWTPPLTVPIKKIEILIFFGDFFFAKQVQIILNVTKGNGDNYFKSWRPISQ
jgi:hypothetical protein